MTTIQEQLRSIDEKTMYQMPTTTHRVVTEVADVVDALVESLERMLLEFDFMVEWGEIPDVRRDIIFVQARAALSRARGS